MPPLTDTETLAESAPDAGATARAVSREPSGLSSVDRWLTLFLRTVGVIDLLAAIAVVLPRSAMTEIHVALGLGPMPVEPIVGYLARSASMFYALTGGLLLFAAQDVQRHRALIGWMARCGLAAGLVLIAIDLAEGMPTWWTLAEGPSCAALSAVALVLQARQGESR